MISAPFNSCRDLFLRHPTVDHKLGFSGESPWETSTYDGSHGVSGSLGGDKADERDDDDDEACRDPTHEMLGGTQLWFYWKTTRMSFCLKKNNTVTISYYICIIYKYICI